MNDSGSTKSSKPTYFYDRDSDTITELTDTGTPQSPLIDVVLFPELLITCEGGGAIGSQGNESRITDLRLSTSVHASGGCSGCMSRRWFTRPSSASRDKSFEDLRDVLLEESNRKRTTVRRIVDNEGKRKVQADPEDQKWFGHLLEKVTRSVIDTTHPIGWLSSCTAGSDTHSILIIGEKGNAWMNAHKDAIVRGDTPSIDTLERRGIHTAIKKLTDKGGGKWVYEFGVSWADEGPW